MLSQGNALRDEGVIKYQPEWRQLDAFPEGELGSLITCRQTLYERDLIGVYDDGIAYGNISQRISGTDQFYISGSATGGLKQTGPEHYSRVDRVDVDGNRLWCSGPIIASSEAMTHAVIYEELPGIDGIIHVHDHTKWQQLLNDVPTTPADIAYGTPEMAQSVSQLLAMPTLREGGIFVMAGHEGGIFSFGYNLASALNILKVCYDR